MTLETTMVPTGTEGRVDAQEDPAAPVVEVTARTAEAVQAEARAVNLGRTLSRGQTRHQEMMLRQSC